MNFNTKIRHFSTVIKPEIFYDSETLNLNFKRDLKNIMKAEWKIIRNILIPKYTAEGYQLQTEKYSDI